MCCFITNNTTFLLCFVVFCNKKINKVNYVIIRYERNSRNLNWWLIMNRFYLEDDEI